MPFILDHQDAIFNVMAMLGIPVFIANAITMFLSRNCSTKWGAFIIKILDVVAMNIKNNENKQSVTTIVTSVGDLVITQPIGSIYDKIIQVDSNGNPLLTNVINDPRYVPPAKITVVRDHDGA